MSAESEWQDLATQGHAVGAIRAYCAAHGVGLVEAMAAVERWRAVNCPPSPAFQRARRVAVRLTDLILEYLAQSPPLSVRVHILPPDPKEVVGQNTRIFSDVLDDRPALDLAVEVAMEGVPAAVREEAAKEHLGRGVRTVWVVETDNPTVHVYTGGPSHPTYAPGAAFDGGDVLPGFSCKVADLFA